MFIKRRIYHSLQKVVNEKEIIVLTGMRRSGKTTLYRMLFEETKSVNKVFLDLENPLEQKVFEESDYNNILANLENAYGLDRKKKMYVFIDEIQAMPEAITAIKYLYDHYDIKFFLTGSSSFYIKNYFPESLAGRKFVFELFPLDFEEFLLFKKISKHNAETFQEKSRKKNRIVFEKIKKLYDEYLMYGGFPGVVLSDGAEMKKLRLNDIFKSYFEKDVKVMADFKDLKAFRDLMLLLMQRAGSKIDISKLAKEVSVSRETLYSYLNFLESTYFVSFLTPFTRNPDREVSGSRKVYLCDTGILNAFGKVNDGSLFENSVFLNLWKYGKLQYYEKRSGGEIDFIIDEKIAIEAKTKGIESDYGKMKRTADKLGLQESYLVTKEFGVDKFIIPATEL
jgi:predicted AAA+ superfamily ATPase